MARTFLVIGEGRSGTSLVSSILHKMGVDMGESRFKGANKGNPLGFFENLDFIKMNIKILEDNGFDINKFPVPDPKKVAKLAPKYDKEIKALVDKFQKGCWGAKDPRFLYTFPLYKPYMESVHFIICYRNPLSVALSLRHQDNKGIGHSLKVVNDYYRTLYEFLAETDYPTLLLAYEKFFDDSLQVQTMCDFVKKPYDKELYTLVRRDLRHF